MASSIFENMLSRDHEQLVFCSDKASGLKAIIAIHDTTLGPALGGTRMWPFKSDEEALIDVLRLSRGMTYKAAAAGLNLGGGKAWISSFTKRASPGEIIDVPLAHKDALYVRSHYDGMTVMVPDAPLADEIAIICCLANRGRLNHRVGGPSKHDIKGEDGLT